MKRRTSISMATLRQVASIERACYPSSVLAAAERATTTMRGSSARFTVALHDGKAAGYAIVEVEGTRGYIADLAVLPAHRRTPGVWKTLLRFMEDAVRDCCVVEADCRETSRGMLLRVLTRRGYRVSSTVDDDFFPGEVVTSIRATKS